MLANNRDCDITDEATPLMTKTNNLVMPQRSFIRQYNPDSKIHGANMGAIWGRQDPVGPHVGPMNFAIWDYIIYFIIITITPKVQGKQPHHCLFTAYGDKCTLSHIVT